MKKMGSVLHPEIFVKKIVVSCHVSRFDCNNLWLTPSEYTNILPNFKGKMPVWVRNTNKYSFTELNSFMTLYVQNKSRHVMTTCKFETCYVIKCHFDGSYITCTSSKYCLNVQLVVLVPSVTFQLELLIAQSCNKFEKQQKTIDEIEKLSNYAFK